MEKRHFNNLVIVGFLKSLTLSFTGLIDCAIVGRYLGADGLSAMKLAIPVFSVLSLFSFILTSGLSVSVSKELSLGNKARANEILRSVAAATGILGACFTAAGIMAPQAVSCIFTGSSCADPVRALTTDYLRMILIGALPILFYDMLGTVAVLGGAYKTLWLSYIALFAADTAGDLLAVHWDQGMLGVAAASSLAYAAAFAAVLLHFLGKRSVLKPGVCLPSFAPLREVISHGLPGGVTYICRILLPIVVNHAILTYGTTAGLAALSIQDAVQYIPCALCGGISSATRILTGVFAAESDLQRLNQEKTFILQWSFIGGTAAAVCLSALAPPMLWLFTKDAAVHSLAVSALWFYLPGVPFIAFNSAAISYFQGLDRKGAAISFSVFCRLLSPVFFAWILGRRFGDPGIYASFSVSEIVVSLALSASLLILKYKKQSAIPDSFIREDTIAELKMNIENAEQAVSASEQVKALCIENDVRQKQAFFVAITAEELAVNSLSHDFGDRKPHHLELRFIVTSDKLLLRLRDDGRPFDLTERFRMIDPDDPTHNIGHRIIFASADDVSYNSALNLNNICIRINRDS